MYMFFKDIAISSEKLPNRPMFKSESADCIWDGMNRLHFYGEIKSEEKSQVIISLQEEIENYKKAVSYKVICFNKIVDFLQLNINFYVLLRTRKLSAWKTC